MNVFSSQEGDTVVIHVITPDADATVEQIVREAEAREWAVVPSDPERYERPRGWGRRLIAAGVVAMTLAALVVAYLVLLPW